MNTTVLALQEEQVLVAVGKSGAQPSVQALYSAPAHGGGMENWEKAIGALWQQHRLPTRGITLVLPDEAVATKTITAPSMPENKLESLCGTKCVRGRISLWRRIMCRSAQMPKAVSSCSALPAARKRWRNTLQ